MIKEKTEAAGIVSEYSWLSTRYPGYTKRMQSLKQCGEHMADVIGITTTDGRKLDAHFDISAFFGKF